MVNHWNWYIIWVIFKSTFRRTNQLTLHSALSLSVRSLTELQQIWGCIRWFKDTLLYLLYPDFINTIPFAFNLVRFMLWNYIPINSVTLFKSTDCEHIYLCSWGSISTNLTLVTQQSSKWRQEGLVLKLVFFIWIIADFPAFLWIFL